MQPHEFGDLIKELKSCFGEIKYSDVRTKSIWARVQDLDQRWLAKLCANSVLNMKDIVWSEEIAKERERHAEKLKREDRANLELKPRHDSMFSKEETNEHFRVMMDAGKGKISKKDAYLYAETVRAALIAAGKLKCKKCNDIGIYSDYDEANCEFIKRCFCQSNIVAINR